MLIHATIMVAPGLDSPLLPVIDLADFAEKLRNIYRRMDDDDQVDVFGTVSELYKNSTYLSVIDPNAHPTASGVESFLRRRPGGYPLTPGSKVEDILAVLVDKGALLKSDGTSGEVVYAPTFLGKKS
jgi:hypothetical protein